MHERRPIVGLQNHFPKRGTHVETLILVRHGHDANDRISETGRAQIQSLRERIASLVASKTVYILSSPTRRALDTADMLSDRLNAAIDLYDVLWSENDHPMNMEKALELIRAFEAKVDVLVVVTHYEYVKDFPAYYGRNVLGVTFPSKLIDKGRAWVIDVEKKQIQCI